MTEAAVKWGGPGEDYRLSRINRTGSRAEIHVDAPSPDNAAPIWQTPKAVRVVPWFEIVMVAIGVAGIIYFMVYAMDADGLTTAVMTLVAVVPLLIVMSAMVFIDRWEPEPVKMKIIAFLWGGGVATVSSMIINTALMTNTALVIGDVQKAQAIAATFVAPVVEETFKGVGVLVIILARRTSINSLLDGVVYGGIVAAGFMFVEDIQYFVRYGSSGTGSLVTIFVLRGLLSPFLHSMATSLTGFAMAWGAIRAKRAWSRILVFLAGWGAAMLVHGLWNSMGSDGQLATLLKMYLFIQVPLFGTWLTALIRASNREAETIKKGLVPYVRTGWILPAEVSMVTDRGKRKAARSARCEDADKGEDRPSGRPLKLAGPELQGRQRSQGLASRGDGRRRRADRLGAGPHERRPGVAPASARRPPLLIEIGKDSPGEARPGKQSDGRENEAEAGHSPQNRADHRESPAKTRGSEGSLPSLAMSA